MDFCLAPFDQATMCTTLALVTGNPGDGAETTEDPRMIHTESCYYEGPEPFNGSWASFTPGTVPASHTCAPSPQRLTSKAPT